MKGKIINDPVYGFIKFPENEVMQLIEHPWFQRLRNIKQMGMAHFVYPGAVHTRFHHSLGAAHLMGTALNELRSKGANIHTEDYIAARQAILLHDIGHGPFSHALEHTLVNGVSHEDISALIMQHIQQDYCDIGNAISIFNNSHPTPFLHQLVSSQLDMDRMDYLNRDSFYTGVSEGVIGYDRILQMLQVKDGSLVVEEKGIHSVEKFIIARRLMYWQVYLHKTVLSAELLIINILKRAKLLASQNKDLFGTPALRFFLYEQIFKQDFISNPKVLEQFCSLDDSDITSAIKVWANHEDALLSRLCNMMLHRKLYKVRLDSEPLDDLYFEKKAFISTHENVAAADLEYFVFNGSTSNSTYNQHDERINILMKDGQIINITQVDNALINAALTVPVKKHYVAFAP